MFGGSYVTRLQKKKTLGKLSWLK